MKTLSGRCESFKEISLSKATKILSKFVSADNGASQVINAYLHRASDAFNELNQLHRELKPSQSRRKKSRGHMTDDSGKVGVSSVTSVDEKLIENDVKLGREINGSVVGGSEKRSKKDKKKKNEFGNKEGDGKLPKKGQNENESGQGDEEMEDGKKQKKDKNLERESAKGREQQKEIDTKISNNGEVATMVKNEIESSQGGEGGTEEGKKQKKEKKKKEEKKNLDGENAEEQKQQNDIEKKMSNNVKVENGGLVVPQDIEIRSKKRHEAGSENKLHAEEIKTEQRKKKRKNEDVEDRSEEQSKKKMKRKHEGQA
ncbi:unnamed protein product [Lathyrus sativus]|nr:unnamed protein product [Lathyrus sativus]